MWKELISKFYILKAISSFLRMVTLFGLPLIFTNNNEFIIYGVNLPILTSITLVSGFGFPVEFTKQLGFGKISIPQYRGAILPIHLISSLFIIAATREITPDLKHIVFIPLLLYVITEVLITDSLRQYQVISNYKSHIVLSSVKSVASFLLVAFIFLVQGNITFTQFLIFHSIINIFIIIGFKMLWNITFKGNYKIYNRSVIISSFLYFFVYLVDRYLISFDKLILTDWILESNLKLLLIIYPLYAAIYSFIEGTFFIRLYNKVLKQKTHSTYFLKKFTPISLLSIPSALIIYFYLKINFHELNVHYMGLITTIFLYIFLSGISWYVATMNYGSTKPVIFLLLSGLVGLIYIILLFVLREMSIDLHPMVFLLILPLVTMSVNSIYRIRLCFYSYS